MIVICFISQWVKRSKHSLSVFPLKKTLICRRHCSISQSCCSMTSKRNIGWFLKPRAFISDRLTKQIALFPFVCCFCFVYFKVIRQIALKYYISSKVLLGLLLLTLFQERLSKKVHATITKAIMGSFECTVLQRNLTEWHIPWVPEAFLAYGGNFRCWPKADTSSAVGGSL